MTIKSLFIFSITFIILNAIYNIFEYWSVKTVYNAEKSDLSLIDFCIENVGSIKWKLRKRLNMKWYNSFRAYKIIAILKSVILVLFSIIMLSLYFFVKSSEYAELLYFKF